MVQFVPFNDFKHDQGLLTKEVLKEIPKQMTRYFQSKKIKPNPPDPAVRERQMLNAQFNLGDSFFMAAKQQMINSVTQYTPDVVGGYLDTVGLPENNKQLLISMLNRQNQLNPLKNFY